MTIPGSANPLLLKSAAAGPSYQVQRSIRLNAADSAYFSRTPGSAGNRKTWTWAGWFKRVKSSENRLFLAGQLTAPIVVTYLMFNDNVADALTFAHYNGSSHDFRLTTSRLFRDFSAWYHILVAVDTTQSTASDRVKIYINGVQETAFATAVYPNQNTDWRINEVTGHQIGNNAGNALLDGYLADIHFIDGQALTPSSFGEVDANGEWQPKAYTGTYGTNGFQLKFADNSAATATTLGKDTSGNGNNWTPNNLSAGADLTGPAAPILNTNASGTAVTSGVRADASASSLVLALAGATASGLNLTDQIPSGRTQAAQIITSNGVTRTTSTSKFYGGSVDCANGQDIQVSYNSSMALGGTFTIEFWANPSAAGNEKTIATFGINEFNGYVLMVGTGGARFRSNGQSDLIYTATISGWNHFAFVASSGGTKRIFVNGVLVASDSGTINATGSYVTYIGSSSANNASFRFEGQFQDFRIYKGLAKYTANFTPVSSPADTDSFVDTPSSYGVDTGAGGEVRGNYATWNPLNASATYTNGNLDVTNTTNLYSKTTIGVSSGKHYCEYTINSASTGYGPQWGFINATNTVYGAVRAAAGISTSAGGVTLTLSNHSSNITSGIIGISLDMDTRECRIYHNNSLKATITGIPAGTYFFYIAGDSSTDSVSLNSGQRPFAYTAPSGFKALCDTNLPVPTIAKGNTVMDVALYTGNGGTRTVSGLGFSPDFVWVKERNGTSTYAMWDQVRGASKLISSNVTAAEDTTNALSSFNSDGFTVVYPNTNDYYVNRNSQAYVAWCWDAGSSTVTNTQGSITSSCRTNQSSGFSIVSYAGGQGSNFTVGHGLNVQPSFVITKARNANDSWGVYYTNNGVNTNWMQLNSTAAQGTNNGPLTGGAYMVVSSTTLQIASTAFANGGSSMIAYCFAPVAGYSSFGSYTGNGSMDGPFVYTGFRPRWVMVKCSSTSGDGWITQDTQRSAQNPLLLMLGANNTGAEGSFGVDFTIDFLSNGFKPRTSGSWHNSSGATYIYAAFAENPFQYARAR